MTNKIPIIVGLDISTTCTGICAINKDTGELVYMHHELMNNKKKFPSFWAKVNHMKKAFVDMNNSSWEIVEIAVEESPKRFTPGFSSIDTILTLAKFNGILCYVMFLLHNLEPTYINVKSARKALGIKIDYKDKSKTTKQKVLEQIFSRNPNFPWIYREIKGEKQLTKINEDRCDAYVIAEAARILHK